LREAGNTKYCPLSFNVLYAQLPAGMGLKWIEDKEHVTIIVVLGVPQDVHVIRLGGSLFLALTTSLADISIPPRVNCC